MFSITLKISLSVNRKMSEDFKESNNKAARWSERNLKQKWGRFNANHIKGELVKHQY